MAQVKICGVRTPEALEAALAGGARFIGLMFFEKSPRNVSFEIAAALAAKARGRSEIVAVTVDPADDLALRISETIKPDWIQLHGRETPARASQLRRFAGKGIIKAHGIAAAEDLDAAAPFKGAADMLLLDAKPPPGADRPGGLGSAFDWTLLQGRTLPLPWMLSGGLSPENVGEAIRLSGASVVDVSSGVESAPGVKDPARIAAFLAAAGARKA